MLSRVRQHKLLSIQERYHAVSGSLARLRAHPQITDASLYVLQFIAAALATLSARLEHVRTRASYAAMNDYEFDSALMLSGRYFDNLVVLLDEIARPITYPAPPELRDSLATVVHGIFGNDGELLLYSEPGINYSINELVSSRLGAITAGLRPHKFVPPPGPTRIFLVGLPSAECDQALIHCIIAHEFGHKAWDQATLKQQLALSSGAEPFSFLANDKEAETAVELAKEWSLELASDLFGLNIFGPAYVCAAIHYAAAITSLDEATPTHPPTRVRLHLLFESMDESYTSGRDDRGERVFAYEKNMAQFFDMWRSQSQLSQLTVSRVAGRLDERVAKIAVMAVTGAERANRLRALARELAKQRYKFVYEQQTYRRDVELVLSIRHFVPPLQYLQMGDSALVSTAGVLNACWEFYLGGLDTFAHVLPTEIAKDRFALSQIFNEFVLKTLELGGLARRWGQIGAGA
jgi:hypothetical protein